MSRFFPKRTKQEKRRDAIFIIVTNILALPISVYLGALMGQLIMGYGKYSVDEEARLAILPDAVWAFWSDNFWVAFLGMLLLMILLNFLAISWLRPRIYAGIKDEERNFEYSDKDTYGTSRWMDEEETSRVFNEYDNISDTSEIIIGRDLKTNKILTMPDNSILNRHKAVIGGSGSGKSAACVRGDMLQMVKRGDSMVITDPSGELYESMSSYLKENGYNVKIFNLVDMEHSDSWNCLAEIENSDINAQIFADTIIQNTDGEKGGGDFWSKCAMNLLKAVCLYVAKSPVIPTNLGEAYKLLAGRSAAELDQLFDAMPMNEDTQAAKLAYNIYKKASDNVKGGVLIDLGSRLQVFQGSLVRKITSYDEIKLEDLGNKKSAFFIVTSDQHSAFDFLAVLFYAMLFIKLVKVARDNGGKLPVSVNFLLDEFSNIGAIPDFKKKISTVRKYNVNITVIVQNIAQIQNRYPHGQWEEILGNCSTTVFLGCTDNTTAKYISECTGTATVVVESRSSGNGGGVLAPHDVKESYGLGKRAVMNADEVKQMPSDEQIVFVQGEKPKKMKKIFYFERPEYESLEKRSIMEYNPQWKLDEDDFNTRLNNDISTKENSSEPTLRDKAKPANKRPMGFK